MSHGKHFTIFTHVGGPNGWKAVMVLKELGLTYESVYLDFAKQEHKAPEFTKYNPNGRIPALIDHKNGDFVIWESSAILLYLVDKYDTEKKLTVVDDNERYSMIQWLFFQASGQGPYFGQAFWYMRFHHEQLPSVIKRFQDETLRVFGVLDSVLKEREWLVGGKCTIADLAFVNWNYRALDYSVKEVCDPEKEFPHFYAWHQKLMARPAVKECVELRAKLVAQ